MLFGIDCRFGLSTVARRISIHLGSMQGIHTHGILSGCFSVDAWDPVCGDRNQLVLLVDGRVSLYTEQPAGYDTRSTVSQLTYMHRPIARCSRPLLHNAVDGRRFSGSDCKPTTQP